MVFARTLLLFALLLPVTAHAVDVGGNITTDTTWTLASSPYRVTSDLTVQAGKTLTIEAGVQVRVVGNLAITVNGNLTVAGTSASPVVMRGDAASPANGAWKGLTLANGSGSALGHLQIQHAATALKVVTPAANAHVIANLTLSGYSSRGLDYVGPGTSIFERIEATTTTANATHVFVSGGSVTLKDSRVRGAAVGVDCYNANVTLDHVTIAQATGVGARVSATSTGTWKLTVKNGTFWKNGNAVEVYRASSSSYQVDLSIDRSIFAENTNVVNDTSSASYRINFQRFVENVWVGNKFSSTNQPSTETGNLNYEPLLADPTNGDFAPTERSPARYFAPTDPTATVGAVAYAGQPSPVGVHGFWYVDKTFAPDSVTEVTGDMVIARGVTVTFLPGATLHMVKGDTMKGGKNTSLVEIRVEGTLEADGTNSKPVRFTSAQATQAPGDWYGLVIIATTEAFNVAQVDVGYAYRGVTLEGNDHIVAGSVIHHCSDAAVYVQGGTPQLEALELHTNYVGVFASDATDLDLVDVDIRGSTRQAARFFDTKATWTLGKVHDNATGGSYPAIECGVNDSGSYEATLTNLTVAHNGGQGVTVYRPSSSSYNHTLRVVDSSVTHNVGAALEDYSSASYRTVVYCTSSNLWGNSAKASNVSFSSDTCFLENPLYVNATARDYAPTTYSPNRHLGTNLGVVGAVQYGGIDGPHLEGWFWEDFTFTKAGSPWPILGDLTVPAGVTVSFEPGARLEIAADQDGMGGGTVSTRSELRVLAGGRVLFDGNGDPIVLTPASETAAPGDWEGLILTDAIDSVIDNARVYYARVGVRVNGPDAPRFEDSHFIYHEQQGLISDGVVTSTARPEGLDVLACAFIGQGTGTGLDLRDTTARVRSSYITHHATGVYSYRYNSGSSTLTMVNNTLVHHNAGVYVGRPSSSSYNHTAVLENNVIAHNVNVALEDVSSASYRTAVTLRNNVFFDKATINNVSASPNTGNLTSDPLVEDDDWDLLPRWWDGKLWMESPTVNAGYNAAALPSRDFAGKARNLGGGIDIGAWEFDPAANREPRADACEASLMVPRGESFALDGSKAVDPDGVIASAWWTMSDGTVTAGLNINHTFAVEGARWAYLTVVDDDGAEDHALVSLNVNIRPIADAGPAVFQDEGPTEDVFFDGTLSRDPDGTVVGWLWDFGDGTPTSTEKSPRHSYASAGLYTVTLTVTDNEGLTHSDTTLATVYGTNDTVGPLIQHVEIADGVAVNTAVTVTADIRDPSGISSAILLYRAIGATNAKFVAMTPPATGHNYTAVIPAGDVTSAGVQYWFIAVDDVTPDPNSSTAPIGAPDADVFDFLVVGDPNPPQIVHTPIANGQTAGASVAVSATITDATGVKGANLYFRPKGGTSFGAAPMTKITGNTWSAQIPAFVVASPGVDYYLEATDSSPIPNTGYAPTGAPTTVYTFTVGSGDVTPPIIAHTPVADGRPAGSAVAITASAADNEAVASVTLYYRAKGAATFASVALTQGGGTSWSGSIPAGSVTTAGVEYYLIAADAAGNTAGSPTAAPTAWHSFTVVAVDTTPPTIVHTRIADGQPSGQSITVSATITDPSNVASAKLFHRPAGFPVFQEVAMVASGNTWTASIPSFVVSPPKVEYYLRATDGAGNTGSDPSGGSGAPYSFTVIDGTSDTTKPTLLHLLVDEAQEAGVDVPLQAVAYDESGVASVKAYYRKVGATTFTELALVEGSSNAWAANLPGGAVVPPGVEYYLVATDKSANANATSVPAGGATAPQRFDVFVPDETAPVITHTPVTTVKTGEDLVVNATVTDAALASVTLRWAAGNGAFASVAMTSTGGDGWRGVVPAASMPQGTTSLRYVIAAVDTSANAATSPLGGEASPYVVSVVTPDTTAPAVTVTAVPDGQAAGVAVVVTATATDAVGVTGATLYHRLSNATGAYAAVTMTAGANNAWSASVPANAVAVPGVSYYVAAVDAAGNTGYGPASAPGTPLTFTVAAADSAAPSITHTPAAGPLTAGAGYVVSAAITDPSGVASAKVYWRTGASGAFTQVAMSGSNGTWTATVPSVAAPSVQYYLEATDTKGNVGKSPANAPTGVFSVDVVVPDLAGPVVTHVAQSATQLPGVALALEAQVSDPSGVASVRVYYRTVGGTVFSEGALSLSGGVWVGVIPAGAVAAPGVEYYLRAVDAAPAANASTSPANAPTALHTVTVGAPPQDTTAPALTHVPVTAAQSPGAAVSVSASVTDASGVASVTVWFRPEGDPSWLTASLVKGAGSTWSGTIPGLAVVPPGVEYYLEAKDASANANVGRHPADAPATVHGFEVIAPDEEGPTVTLDELPGSIVDGTPLPVGLTAEDPSGVAGVDLYYRMVGDAGWAEAAMSAGANGRWAVVLPASELEVGTLRLYAVARDGLGNETAAPAGGAAAAVSVQIEPPAVEDIVAPLVLHSPVTVVEEGEPIVITAIVTDASGVARVRVLFREGGGGAFASVDLTDEGQGRWGAEIPGFATRGASVEYYLEATDAALGANKAFDPAGAPATMYLVEVLSAPVDTGPTEAEPVEEVEQAEPVEEVEVVEQADVVEPEPDVVEPEPDTAQPDTTQPDTEQPDTAQPDVLAEVEPVKTGGSDGGCGGGFTPGLLGLAALLIGRRRSR